MYEKYLLQLEEAGKIRNLKERSINCYKNYVSYFLNFLYKTYALKKRKVFLFLGSFFLVLFLLAFKNFSTGVFITPCLRYILNIS